MSQPIAMPQTDPWPEIEALFLRYGEDAYFGEPVTQLQHALQCAALAVAEDADDTLVVAALLHDIGHLLHGCGEDIADRGVDANHEQVGAQYLARRFGEPVAGPARGHVDAKRYLCATDPAYAARLSPASIKSLALQGGPMDADETAAFEADPFHRQTVCLRRWDDAAKDPTATVPGIAAYRDRIRKIAR